MTWASVGGWDEVGWLGGFCFFVSGGEVDLGRNLFTKIKNHQRVIVDHRNQEQEGVKAVQHP